MKIIVELLVSAMLGLSTAIGAYFLGKRLVKHAKEQIFEEFQDYFGSPEGQQSVFNLGQIFAAGIGKGIGLDGSALKGKTFGIPNQLIMKGFDYFTKKKTDKAITEEKHKDTSGKFG